MTTVTVEAFASFGPHPLPEETLAADIVLLSGNAPSGRLDHYRFRFVDGQKPRPGSRGVVRLLFATNQLPPTSGPLTIWAGRVVGHVWGLRTLHSLD